GSTHEKKPGLTRALLRQQVESACDLNQVSHLLDGTSAVGPFDVSFITHDRLDHSVSTFQNAEAADQIDLGPHRDARTAGIEQAAKSGNHPVPSLKQRVVGSRIQQAQAIFQFAQILSLGKKCFHLAIFLPGQIVIDGIQQFANNVHMASMSLIQSIYCTAPLSAYPS